MKIDAGEYLAEECATQATLQAGEEIVGRGGG
jgi:hypothetical protein